jgi:molybdopterin/thiamine biosynthesis adenylyltransferase
VTKTTPSRNAAIEQPFHERFHTAQVSRIAARSVALAGLGNIGSQAVSMLARCLASDHGADRPRFLLIDRGQVESKNMFNQNFLSGQEGRPKAEVMAELVRRVAPNVHVEPIVADVENIPLDIFAGANLCMGGLDSLRARQVMANEIAYRLGLPFVDGAVDAAGDWIGRVQVLVPGQACLECTWGEDHYRQVGRETPCAPGAEADSFPTWAAAPMGCAVASLMVAEAVKILAGHTPPESIETTFDLSSRRWLTSTMRRAGGCRFDHGVISENLTLDTPFANATAGDLLDLLRRRFGGEPVQLEFHRHNGDVDGFRRGRFISTDELANVAMRRLSEFQLGSRDHIEIKYRDNRVAIAFRQT